MLKQVLSAKDIDLLIRESVQGEHCVEQGYAGFCSGLDHALNTVADELSQRDNASLAYEAIHFALASYAAGVVCDRYIALLRQSKEAQPTDTKKSRKEHD